MLLSRSTISIRTVNTPSGVVEYRSDIVDGLYTSVLAEVFHDLHLQERASVPGLEAVLSQRWVGAGCPLELLCASNDPNEKWKLTRNAVCDKDGVLFGEPPQNADEMRAEAWMCSTGYDVNTGAFTPQMLSDSLINTHLPLAAILLANLKAEGELWIRVADELARTRVRNLFPVFRDDLIARTVDDSRRVRTRIAILEDLPIAMQARAVRPYFMDQILPVEVDERAQPVRTKLGGPIPSVSFEQPVAVASASSEPLPQPRPFSHSRVYTPLARAQHPEQPMPFAGPSVTGVRDSIGFFQDQMQEFLRERRERIARADLPRNAPPGPTPTEAGISVLSPSTAPAPGSQDVKPATVPPSMRTPSTVSLPPASTVLPARPVQTAKTSTAVPGAGVSALVRTPLHPAAPPPPAAPATSAVPVQTQKAKSPPPPDSKSH